MTLAELTRGREVYVSKCGGCHRLWPPGSLSRAEWLSALPGMDERAGLDADQRRAVEAYLWSFARED